MGGKGRSSDRQRAGEVEFSRTTSALEIAIDGRYRDLLGFDRNTRTGSDACATPRVDEFHTDFQEQVVPSHAFSEFFHLP